MSETKKAAHHDRPNTDIPEGKDKFIKWIINDGKPKLFNVRSANQCIEEAKKQPIPKTLLGELWHEGELHINFAESGAGKSILGVQTGDSISKGIPIEGLGMEAEKQIVLYFDYELQDKQFENRYSNNYEEHYSFDENFKRITINPDAEIPTDKFDEFLFIQMEECIKEYDAKIIIVDNLTWLRTESTEKAKDALPLMKALSKLKKQYGLSILALSHTPKRKLDEPITQNHLSGSKMLMNFIDSASAIGMSHSDKNIRYIKQIKERAKEKKYDSSNVALFKVGKESNFLQFTYLGTGNEFEHLKPDTRSGNNDELKQSISDLMATGLTDYAIAQKLLPDGVNFKSFHVKVNRVTSKIRDEENNGNK
jgi:archaellum biogenesis ATPase FlaH